MISLFTIKDIHTFESNYLVCPLIIRECRVEYLFYNQEEPQATTNQLLESLITLLIMFHLL